MRAAEDMRRPLLLIFLATRPCFIKLASLIHAADAVGAPHLVVDSGQHFEEHLTAAQHELGYGHRIAVHLDVRGDLIERSGDVAFKLKALAALLSRHRLRQPAVPVVSGDTSTAGTIPSLWYLHTGLRSVHVEAGLRSEGPAWRWPASASEALSGQRAARWVRFPDEPYPEGLCTRLASVASDVLFAPVERNRRHLQAEAYRPEQIAIVGSLSSDAVILARQCTGALDALLNQAPRLASGGPWLRVDVHRRENMTAPKLRALLDGIARFAAQGAPVVLVRTNAFSRAIDEHGLAEHLADAERRGVLVTPPWPSYASVVQFLASPRCHMILTDSGGLQEEAHALGTPCFTARRSTDRPETILDVADSPSLGGNRLLPLFSGAFIADGLTIGWSRHAAVSTRTPGDLYGREVGAAMMKRLCAYQPRGAVSPPAPAQGA
ncbi:MULTISPECIES: UDP-N-acetylglucosamine 2-epimerase [Sorangium]|uniref:UDP-N-acetylglucosamine 2-epimerase n=1 Tax=Sorangium TaxID=39643 RepID=UPI001A926720|nr:MULTISPECIES: UDP-N-acetylglucosamine 2-epimerase [Sorangium]